MSHAPVIAAFDLATSTGVCWGPVGGKPNLFTIDCREGGPGRPSRLVYLFDQLEDFFRHHHIDVVRYEEPMAVAVANKIGVTTDTITLLHGVVAILELCAVRARVFDINKFSVQDARHHLTGARRHGGKGKQAVLQVCKTLGVEVSNDNEGDAFAGWSYACGLANPRIAHLVTPLFARE
jgi:hypothetical protein